MPAPTLQDAELTLLPWRDVNRLPGVRGDLIASCNDPAMVRWTTVAHPSTGGHADDFLTPVREGVCRWAYVVDSRYCGNIELRRNDDATTGILGYSTAPWARGRGLTTRAVRLVTTHAFDQGLQQLELHIAEGNAASRRTAEKAGFAFDCLLPDPVRVRGHEEEIIRYVLLAATGRDGSDEPNSTAIAP